MARKINEECSVFGISGKTAEAAGITYNGLLSLQHRGQESAGIAVISGNTIHCLKDEGLVSEVFSGGALTSLPASFSAIGHTRYSTAGRKASENSQPFVTEYLTGRLATALNGNVLNAGEIREKLERKGLHFRATSDSEVVSSLIAYHTMRNEDFAKGVIEAADELRGAFSLVVLCSDGKLAAVRDPDGYRPLCIGKNEAGIAISSESCALDCCGFSFVRDVRPGEIILAEKGGISFESVELSKKTENAGLCIFEYVYFARPDSTIDGLSVYEARFNMGRILAREYPIEADIVCGVPDSGLEAAIGYSAESGIALVPGFVKSRYIGRSFIFPTQSERESAVRMKLNPLSVNVRGKRIVLVDDSIVRGTTTAKTVKSLRAAGAKEVHIRISSPPFRFMCHYGTDIESEENLIANKISLDEIRDKIGVDSLGYISIEGLKEACAACRLPFCDNCFTGNNKSR